ncbi:MAG: imidazoleglycerol-phosphate dehydratase [Spirochaetes bacterium DG_61]|jgi:imidazoleglycerol-phosphate dehydratase|nr:MAG: imidazoleglycerol-phosphate dehydratase [Spirochaetes bacterium DG_61]
METERRSHIKRSTKETQVEVDVNLDGTGSSTINTGIPFFNHLLEIFSKHSRFDLNLHAEGDIEVDFHHLVEDTGITMGEALGAALGTKGGIKRFSSSCVPFDETLVRVCVDLSGRPYLHYQVPIDRPVIVHFDAGLIEDFLRAFVHSAGITLHVDLIRGTNPHHIVEAVFKALARCLFDASEVIYSQDDIPSTKGVL